MNEYMIVNGHILSRMILIVIFVIHCLIAYGFQAFKMHIPGKFFHGFFITEFVALTVFVVWSCINEPFKDGVALAVIGYAFVYLILFMNWVMLSHATISHTKTYQMIPHMKVELEGKRGVTGHIQESGINYMVIVFDEDFYNSVKDNTPVDVKFKKYPEYRRDYIAPYAAEMQLA